jgi:hypothetical protein
MQSRALKLLTWSRRTCSDRKIQAPPQPEK